MLSRFFCFQIVGMIAAFSIVGCRIQTQEVKSPANNGGSFHPYAGNMEPDDHQWVRATKDFANTRYSTLDQINTSNVANLKVAWTFDTGVSARARSRAHCGQQHHVRGSPWPNKLFALDLDQAGSAAEVEL